MNKPTVFLTGVAGFIGSHLAEALLKLGYEIFAVDNFDPYYSRDIKEKNLKHLKEQKNFHFFEVDLLNQKQIQNLFETAKPQIVLHMAAKAGVRPSLEAPADYVRANVEATTTLLDLSVRYTVSRFVFASSSSVYGNLSKAPYSIQEKNLFPISPYGASKLACEKMSYSFSQCYALPCVALRFFTVYGPRQRPDLAIHKFIHKMSKGEPIEIFGDGSTARDYTYIDDIIDGIINSMISPIDDQAVPYRVYNLGNQSPVTLKDLIKTLEKVTKIEAIKIQRPDQTGDVQLTYADISDSQKELKYSPKISFEEGIEKFWSWYQSQVKI